MGAKRLPIYWQGKVVGQVEGLTGDNFDLYGRWLPDTGSPAHEEFIRRLEAEEQLEVRIGDGVPELRGTIDIVPEDMIEIKGRP